MRYVYVGYDRNKNKVKAYIDAETRYDAITKLKTEHEILVVTKLKESKEIPIIEKTKKKLQIAKETRALKRQSMNEVTLSKDNLNYIIEQSKKTGGLLAGLQQEDIYLDSTQKPKIDKRKIQKEYKVERGINWDLFKTEQTTKSKKRIKVKKKDIIVFTSQLATMTNSGVTIIKSLKILSERTKSKKFKEVIEGVSEDVQRGNMLSQALALYPTVFDFVYVSTVQIGETSGSLGKCLMDIVEMDRKKLVINKKVKSATVYPTMVLIVLGLLMILASVFLIPHFRDMFDSEVPLPKLTENVFYIADHIPMLAAILIVFLIVLKILRIYMPALDKAIKLARDRALLEIPIIKTVSNTLFMYYTSSTLALMIKNGITIKDSLELTQRTVPNFIIQSEIGQVIELIIRGSSLSEAMDSQQHFDGILVSIVATGEESGKMAESLKDIADYYSKELDSQLETMVEYIMPLATILIGLIVAPVVIAIYLPVFEMTKGGGMM